MASKNDAKLIAEYERLRERLFELEALATAIDHRLVELEALLPPGYVHPCERAEFKRRKLGNKQNPGD